MLVRKVRVIAAAITELDREVSVDSSIVRAHQHAADTRRPRPHTAIGRSRGGPTTKIHLACDGHGRPLSVLLTAGNVNDCTIFVQVLAGIRMPRPRRVIADKAYSTHAIRSYLRRRGIACTIPERRDQQANRARPRQRAWPHTRLRPHRLPTPQRRGTLLQPVQAVPRPSPPATTRPPSHTKDGSTSPPMWL